MCARTQWGGGGGKKRGDAGFSLVMRWVYFLVVFEWAFSLLVRYVSFCCFSVEAGLLFGLSAFRVPRRNGRLLIWTRPSKAEAEAGGSIGKLKGRRRDRAYNVCHSGYALP